MAELRLISKKIGEIQEVMHLKKQLIPKPLVSICILVHNNKHLVEKCIDSIIKYTQGIQYEVIVLNNGSKEKGIQELLKSYDGTLHVIQSDRNIGSPRGMNECVRRARGEYIVTLNSDTEVAENWIQTMLKYMEDERVAIVGAYTTNGVFGKQRVINESQWLTSEEVNNIVQFCALIRKKVWDEIGGWNIDFGQGYFEDTYFSYLVHQKGYKQIIAPVYIKHHGAASLGYNDRFNELMFRNQALYYKKRGDHKVIQLQIIMPKDSRINELKLVDLQKIKNGAMRTVLVKKGLDDGDNPKSRQGQAGDSAEGSVS